MQARRHVIALVGVLGLLGRLAAADPDADPAEPKLITPSATPATKLPSAAGYSHKGKLEVSLRAAVGLRAIATYGSGNYCGKTDVTAASQDAPVCTGRSPFAFDLELGYGLTSRIDLIGELRLGLEQDFPSTASGNDGPHEFHLSPGARFFFSDARSSKLFTTAQLVFDFTGFKNPDGTARGTDFGVRNMNGLWFDLDRAYGVYVYVGESATVVRWLQFELEAGIGVQARYP